MSEFTLKINQFDSHTPKRLKKIEMERVLINSAMIIGLNRPEMRLILSSPQITSSFPDYTFTSISIVV